MKYVRDDAQRLATLLLDYIHPLGMAATAGPLRAMRELTAGVLFTGSVQLTNAARLFCHTPAELDEAVKRLSRHLADPHWNHQEWAAAVLQQLADAVADDDLIPIDGTELAKPYSRHMQYQCTIRDASRPGNPLVDGYWCFGAYHWQPRNATLSPLMLRPWSTRQPRFLSENDLTDRWLWTLRQATAGRGIWLIDRGGDRPEVLATLLRCQARWIVRVRGDRGLIGPDGTRRSARQWGDWALANRKPRGRAVSVPVKLPADDVAQPQGPAPLWLVVPTYTFQRDGRPERWLLLTRGLIDQHAGPRQVRHFYALRWRGEDAKRFLGQIWHVERFLTRSFLALERMLWCVCLAGGFLAMLRREKPQLAKELEQEVTYWDKDGPVEVPGYRTARGIHAAALRTRDWAMPVLNNA